MTNVKFSFAGHRLGFWRLFRSPFASGQLSPTKQALNPPLIFLFKPATPCRSWCEAAFTLLQMKKLMLCALMACYAPVIAFAQKEDFIWVLGSRGGTAPTSSICIVNFNEEPPLLEFIDKKPGLNVTNTSICDATGELKCFSNGTSIFNPNFEKYLGAEDMLLNPNYPKFYMFANAALILPFPQKKDTFIFLSGDEHWYTTPQNQPWNFVGFKPIRYSVFSLDSTDEFNMIKFRQPIAQNHIAGDGHLVAMRHGNGRDWWVMVPKPFTDEFLAILIDPSGVHLDHVDKTGQHLTDLGTGQTAFSPNGEYFAHYRVHSIGGLEPRIDSSSINIYKFDRCTGDLSIMVNKKRLTWKFGGVAFSENSRYLYVSRLDTIEQYDMLNPDVLASETVVAVYDGFKDTVLTPVPQSVMFFLMKRGPNGKIYINIAPLNAPYLHVIDQPNEKGMACNVLQHSIELPVWNSFSIPNIPEYRLGKKSGSACDSLVAVEAQPPMLDFSWTLSPNPANDFVFVESSKEKVSSRAELHFSNVLGQTIFQTDFSIAQTTIRTADWPAGLYLAQLFENGILKKTTRLIVAH